MEPLIKVDDIRGDADWDAEMLLEAEQAIEELSDDARHYGLKSWVDPDVTPVPVCRIVRKAARRYMKNYEGFVQSRAGDETLVWDEQGEDAGSPYFTEKEITNLRSYRGLTGLNSVQVSAYGATRRGQAAGYVPTEGGAPFPLYASEDGPW